MTILISGNFQQQTEAQHAIRELASAGFLIDQMTTFYVSSAGQHDLYPLGGDESESPGMKGAAAGAISGITVGGVIGVMAGIASSPVLGPGAAVAGAGVGAYVGSLYGALGGIDDKQNLEAAACDKELPALQRQAGMLVAVCAPASTQQDKAVDIFRKCGAIYVDRVEGSIVAGEWTDFNPLMPLKLLTV